ncbi:hypothetical protein GT347_02960 [Xylophilus rhododendri]|uniref:Uncharacterized protein n=1 Tax=Xylophilus rhododendri TaxID=2697032 RepID=A0A857J2D4_9BURK|nr:hypothetical protein [Xylophilus rhododendri]QHI97035.1 hypothetical protein GT347_02960 [Xylophilus rhododendri]
MPTYLKIVSHPAASFHAYRGGIRVAFADPTAPDWQIAAHFSNNQFEYGDSICCESDREPIATEGIKAAESKLKITSDNLQRMEWAGNFSERVRLMNPVMHLGRPADFALELYKPILLKPLPEACPYFALRLSLLNESVGNEVSLLCYVNALLNGSLVRMQIPESLLREERNYCFLMNGQYFGHIEGGRVYGWHGNGIKDGLCYYSNENTKPGDKFELRLGSETGPVVYSDVFGISVSLEGTKISLGLSETLVKSGLNISFFKNDQYVGDVIDGVVNYWRGGKLQDGTLSFYREDGAPGDLFEVRKGGKNGEVIYSKTFGISAWLFNGTMFLRLDDKLLDPNAGVYTGYLNGIYSGGIDNGTRYYWNKYNAGDGFVLLGATGVSRDDVFELRRGGDNGPVIYKTVLGYTSDLAMVGKSANG